MRKLKIKGDVFRTGMLESFPIEYMKLRYDNVVRHFVVFCIWEGNIYSIVTANRLLFRVHQCNTLNMYTCTVYACVHVRIYNNIHVRVHKMCMLHVHVVC